MPNAHPWRWPRRPRLSAPARSGPDEDGAYFALENCVAQAAGEVSRKEARSAIGKRRGRDISAHRLTKATSLLLVRKREHRAPLILAGGPRAVRLWLCSGWATTLAQRPTPAPGPVARACVFRSLRLRAPADALQLRACVFSGVARAVGRPGSAPSHLPALQPSAPHAVRERPWGRAIGLCVCLLRPVASSALAG
ncbi:unnamed protein product [Amoebophrya sp. A120]|nr:unnamed protein product [Amoebophrya sp. A120]|eukprot:GSA120T00024615001.1